MRINDSMSLDDAMSKAHQEDASFAFCHKLIRKLFERKEKLKELARLIQEKKIEVTAVESALVSSELRCMISYYETMEERMKSFPRCVDQLLQCVK
jgi:2'-5' RNA ligase